MMMHTSETDMANSDEPADIDTFINNAAWAIRKTYHKILKASPGAAQHSNMTRHDLRCPVRSSLIHGRIGVTKTDRSNTTM